MGLTETVLEGTIQPDGSLVLDEPIKLPAGRVQVVLRQVFELGALSQDPFWQRMQAIWAIPIANPDGGESSLKEVQKMREEWEEHQVALEQLQEECQRANLSTEETKP